MRQFLSRWASRWFGSRADSGESTPTGSMTATAPTSMLDCDAVMRQLWDYLDGELTPERMAAMGAHLDVCKRCFPQLEFERSFLEAVAGTAPTHSHPERLRARIVSRLRESGMTES